MGMFKLLSDKAKAKQAGRPKSADKYEGAEVLLDPDIFGTNCKSKTMPVSFVFGTGGVGDYINWSAALLYVADKHKHVDGRIYVSELFYDVAQYLFGNFPRWKVHYRKDFRKYYEPNSLLAHPKAGSQLINACGTHLMDLGFMYFCCMSPPPAEYNLLPQIKYEGEWKWPELDPKSPYAIFTPGATTGVREMPVKGFNEIAAYAKSKGVTPVFLGKKYLSMQYEANFAAYDYSLGIDLRERTNLLEAVQIMRGAKFVIGLDNGLLHMAGTTETPVIFGHNIASVEHRVLRRPKGLTINVKVDQSELSCIGCQSKMRFLYHQDFKKCLFEQNPTRDKKCLELLHKNDSAVWKWAIDKALEHAAKRA